MKVCFPVAHNHGLESQVYEHFGSAPGFVLVDLATGDLMEIGNRNQVHRHGACNPVAGLGGHEVDALVVGGIGGGALQKLNMVGMRVFQSQGRTIGENIQLLRNNSLREFLPGHACGRHAHDHHHGNGHGCNH